jgi:hypothetical protein
MSILVALFYIPIFLAIALGVRVVFALVSPDSRRSLRQHPILHLVWFLAIPACFLLYGVSFSAYLHRSPWFYWSERREQRQQVLERVQSAGGWAALRRDCVSLARQHPDDPFVWRPSEDLKSLPPTIAALKPKEVTYYSPKLMQDFKSERHLPIVRIMILGQHPTGGHTVPEYGLEVMSGDTGEVYQPPPNPYITAPAVVYWHSRNVADDIYEIY